MAVYTQGLVIDGIIYDIPFVKISRTMDFLENMQRGQKMEISK